MRPAGRSETDSLYFDYPHFPFVRPPELAGQAVRHRVAIVGAGPVGVTAALELARELGRTHEGEMRIIEVERIGL